MDRFTCPRRGEFLRINTEPFVLSEDGPDTYTLNAPWQECSVHGCFAPHDTYDYEERKKGPVCPEPIVTIQDPEPTCSYCGSLPGDRFMELIKSGTQLSGSDKSYKTYLHMETRSPGKFYWQHLTQAQRDEFIELYNEKKLNLEPHFGLYVLPFFARREQEVPNA